MDFGAAVKNMKAGRLVTRMDWGNKGAYIALQKVDSNSKMTKPYIYIKTVKGDLVPWFASQEDILADDWRTYSILEEYERLYTGD